MLDSQERYILKAQYRLVGEQEEIRARYHMFRARNINSENEENRCFILVALI